MGPDYAQFNLYIALGRSQLYSCNCVAFRRKQMYIYIYFPTSPRASQSMSFAEMGLKGRCAEGLFNAEHSTAECLWKCRWIYGRGICRTISLSHLRFFRPFHTLIYARIVSRYVGKQNCREQAWAIVSKALKGTCKGPKRYVKALKGT